MIAATVKPMNGAALKARVKVGTRRLGPSGIVSLAVLVLIVATALAAPFLAPQGPNQPNLMEALEGPSLQHLLGTDSLGRDLLVQLIYGSRPTVMGSLLVIALSTVVGTALALLASWQGGVVDNVVSRVMDVLFSIPSIVLALTTVAILGAGLSAAIIGLVIAYTPYVARVVRSAAVRERELPYVSAVWIQGRSGPAIAWHHLLPNLGSLITAQAVSALGFAVVDLASLSFLGLGVQPPSSDWGLMVQEGMANALRGQPAEAIAACVAIVIFVGAATVLGDRLTKEVSERG